MAHLTISLGAPVVVPLRIPRGWNRQRRVKAWNASVRWRSIYEAGITAVTPKEIGRSFSLQAAGNPRRHHAPVCGKGIQP